MSYVSKMTSRYFLALAMVAISSVAFAAGPVIFEENFENGASKWKPTDPSAWKITKTEDQGNVYSLFKDSNYKTPVTSPYNISWLQDVELGDFQATLKVRSTTKNYGHRDLCFFLGYQDPSHFYYCHLSKEMDDRANQIFVVDGKPRTKISEKTTDGVPWDNAWHTVRIVRKVSTGLIEVYFDDMETPIMVANDKTHGRGLFGIGSFDDTGDFASVKIESLEAASSSSQTRSRRLFSRLRARRQAR